MQSDRVKALVTRLAPAGTYSTVPPYCFAADDWGREYFVHRKNVSEIGEKGWDWVLGTFGDYVVEVEGIPVQESATRWILLEVRVL